MMIVAFLGALAVTPLWAFSADMAWIIVGAVVMQFMVQGAWGIIPAHINELSPDQVAAFCPASPTSAGTSLPLRSPACSPRLAERYPYSWVMATSAATIFLVAIAATALGRERHGVEFGGSQSEIPPLLEE